MKYLSLIFLSSLLAFSGASGCSESATNLEEAPVVQTDNASPSAHSTTNTDTPAPDDLSGTNLAPPPAPPSN